MKIALIHGWGIGSEIWSPILDRLESQFEVLRFDLAGYGSRASEPFPSSIQALADDAHQRIPAGMIWVGWSLGAMVSIAAASQQAPHQQAPHQRGLLLVCPTLQFCDRRGSGPVDDLATGVDADPAKALRRFALSLPASQNRRALKSTLAQFAADTPSKDTLLAGLEILGSCDLSPQAAGIDLPVHVIAGGSDQIIPASHASKVSRLIRGSGFDELSCGHVPFLECPDLFVERLVEFAKATF